MNASDASNNQNTAEYPARVNVHQRNGVRGLNSRQGNATRFKTAVAKALIAGLRRAFLEFQASRGEDGAGGQ
jgi:hypothetical protein